MGEFSDAAKAYADGLDGYKKEDRSQGDWQRWRKAARAFEAGRLFMREQLQLLLVGEAAGQYLETTS